MPVAAGTRLGPYEVVELLGSGGMGEVYRARDPRLGRDVALKVLHDDVASDPARLKRFELEARAVAALNHPHILTVHDVGSHDGTPYVVSELLEGESLREVLSRRSPTQRQVLSWAVQAAQGLAAAHRKGIVHRDLKPENLFLTSDGRIKVLDFGLAKQSTTSLDSEELTASSPTKPGVVMGTVAYMSPEQAQAQPVDARSDLFSFGVVLYELLARKHPFRRETVAATLGAILQEVPPALVSLDATIPRAVDAIVRRCLEKRREERFQGAHDLGLALEAVLQASTGSAVLEDVEERSPYPGLSSFTEKDASVFFGREAEVKALWERIRSRKLLGVIGPSGVGKTSFLRAGVMASRPEGWSAVQATPGSNPALGLAQALTPDLVGDAEAMRELLRGVGELAQTGEAERVVEATRRWRSRHAEALLVLDQFEELFTLNPKETQAGVAALLKRLVSEADVHVVLSMRDDFLIRCSDHDALAPVFETLTPLTALTPDGLRRAVVEPAKKRGYRFDDDALVDEMVGNVEGVRGALPLLAFAVARLWEKRDRERKLLTHEAYREIAGVEGALAQHAEATMDRIGPERQATVREVFRNLVTAQGTRAVIDREELLSAFPERKAADEVLNQLIDARLLTTYEVEGKGGEPSHHRVEVVHESLLKAWPRLVRWQAQDEEGAVLRDQLKQAAHLWDEKGRKADLLWTGTAYTEYELWRSRYPGALTALEEDFARSMADKARRRKRVRTAVVASVIAALAAVAVAIGVSRQKAVVAARKAEASKLLALAQLKLQDDPTEALALTTASLQLADANETRAFAARTLWEAPPAFELIGGSSVRAPAFSPDGRWLAAGGHSTDVRVWADDGRGPLVLPGHEANPNGPNFPHWASGALLVTGAYFTWGGRAYLWTLPEGKLIRTIDFGGPSYRQVAALRLFADTPATSSPQQPGTRILRSWTLPDGKPLVLGQVDWKKLGTKVTTFAPDGRNWLYARGRDVYARPLPFGTGPDRLFARMEAEIAGFLTGPDWLLVMDRARGLRFWLLPPGGDLQERAIRRPDGSPPEVMPEASGRWLIGYPPRPQVSLWDLAAWPAARPRVLRRSGSWYGAAARFDPKGDWVVASTASATRLTFWPLRRPYPFITDGYKHTTRILAFSPDSRWLATAWADQRLRLWPLPGTDAAQLRLREPPSSPVWGSYAFDPKGRYLFAVGVNDGAFIVPLDGSLPRSFQGPSKRALLYAAAVSPSGRLAATAFGYGQGRTTLRVIDVETGEQRTFDLPEGPRPSRRRDAAPEPATGYERGLNTASFVDEATLYTAGDGGLRRWNIEKGTHELVAAAEPGSGMEAAFSADGRVALTVERRLGQPDCPSVMVHELTTGALRPATQFGDCLAVIALDPSGTVAATGGLDGTVRVGRISGGEPHLLVGHKGTIAGVAISPDLRWVATSGEDDTLRLWPMPDLNQRPLHTLPRGELLAKLKSLTNLRAVRDAKSSTAWTVELGPFPGWKDVPSW